MTQKIISLKKVKYAFYPDWTVQEAIFLSLGKNPLRKKPLLPKHLKTAEHLQTKLNEHFNKNGIKPTFTPRIPYEVRAAFGGGLLKNYKGAVRDLYPRYPTSIFMDAFKDFGFKYDKDIEISLNWVRKTIFENSDNQGQIDKSFYRQASDIVTELYGSMPKNKMAPLLRKLVIRLNKKYEIAIPVRNTETIENYLIGVSSAKAGRPKKDAPEIEINWKELLSKF